MVPHDRVTAYSAAQVFLEPEGRDTPELYVQGFSTGLPERLQLALLRTLPGDCHCTFCSISALLWGILCGLVQGCNEGYSSSQCMTSRLDFVRVANGEETCVCGSEFHCHREPHQFELGMASAVSEMLSIPFYDCLSSCILHTVL